MHSSVHQTESLLFNVLLQLIVMIAAAHVFTMFVIMAVVTTVMTGPLLRVLLPRAGYVIPEGVEA